MHFSTSPSHSTASPWRASAGSKAMITHGPSLEGGRGSRWGRIRRSTKGPPPPSRAMRVAGQLHRLPPPPAPRRAARPGQGCALAGRAGREDVRPVILGDRCAPTTDCTSESRTPAGALHRACPGLRRLPLPTQMPMPPSMRASRRLRHLIRRVRRYRSCAGYRTTLNSPRHRRWRHGVRRPDRSSRRTSDVCAALREPGALGPLRP